MDEKLIKEALTDSGCNEEVVSYCSSLLEKKEYNPLLTILKKERKNILDKVRQGEREIEIMDYIIFNLNKEKENESKI